MGRPIGIVTAMTAEARALLGAGHWAREGVFRFREGRLAGGREYVCVLSGPGPERAEAAARFLVRKGVFALVSAGVSGGLNDCVEPGSVLVGDSIYDADKGDVVWSSADQTASEACAQLQGLGIHALVGGLAAVGRAVASAKGKRSLFARSNALGVDMESGAVARVAVEKGLRFFVLRAVCDHVETEIPREFLAGLGVEGKVKPLSILVRLLCRPGLLRVLLGMNRDFRVALSGLSGAWKPLSETVLKGL